MAKKFLSILLTLVLALGLLPAAGAAAVSTSPTFSDMPDNWATEALESAVANGLLVGDGGKIMPDSPLTRAQMATIIARAFGATEEGDISEYTDVTSTDWFASSMGKAYKMGVMQGYSGKMDPNSNITREQAFAVLARALKLEPATVINKTFEDQGEISDWAKSEVYALVNAGYIQGSNGKLNPQANISRAEFAQVMYNLIIQYISTGGEYTEVANGNIMVNVSDVTLKNLTVNGDLIVGDGVGDGDLILDNVTIKGRLLARGGGVNSIIIIGGSVEGKVIVAKVDGDIRVSVEGGADVEVIVIDDGKDDVIIEGTVGTVEVTAPDVPVIIQNATINKVDVNCKGAANITVAEDGRVTNVVVGAKSEGTALSVEGSITNIETSAPDTGISGTGTVGTVTANEGADNTSVTTPNTVVNNEGASGVTAGGGKEVPEDGSVTNNSQGTNIITTPPSGGESYYVGVDAVAVNEPFLLVKADENEPIDVRTIVATVSPTNASDKRVTWSSSDETVATVDDNGVITGISGGTAIITVTSVDDTTIKATVHVVVGDLLVPAGWSIQDVIDDAEAGQVIAVAPAEYKEQLVIDKPLTLLGPNAGITGYSEDRLGEATITYPDDITDTSLLSLLRVTSGNVTVKGFFFKNHKPNQEYQSQDEILFEGENSVFENNRVELHVYKKALKIIGSTSLDESSVGGAVVKGNYIESLNGRTNAVYIQGIGAMIENNTIISDAVAIQIQPYGNNIGGIVKNNNLSAYRYTVWHNYDMAVSGTWTYEGNYLYAEEPSSLDVYQEGAAPPHLWRGIVIQTESPDIEFKNNTIDGSNAFENGIINGEYWSDVIGMQFNSGLKETSVFDIHDNIITDVTIGVQDDAGHADLNQILDDNTFPEEFVVFGNTIVLSPSDTSWYNDTETTFTLTSARELNGLAELVNNGTSFEGKTITLGANIDLAETEWTPIGNKSDERPFSGVFDGNNKTISNLTFNIDDTSGYYGMFGYLSGAVIKDFDFVGANVCGGFRLGVLCGYADSATTIDAITVDDTSIVSNTRHAAGICGESEGIIRDCSNEATVSSDSEWGAAAGIAAWLEGTAENCMNTGSITSQKKNGVAGGIAGYAVGGTITNSSNSGIISVAGSVTHAYAGGIAAYTEGEVTVTDCTNSGEVNADDETSNTAAFKRCAGGVVGYHNTGTLSILRSINTGEVIGYNYAGGMIGHIISTGFCDVKYCYNNGAITSNYTKDVESPSYASGIVGYTGNYNWGQQVVEYCLNAGSVTNNASNGSTLQVAYNPSSSYYYCENTAYDTSGTIYDGTIDGLANVLNTGLEIGSEFWGMVDDVIKPLSLTLFKVTRSGETCYYSTFESAAIALQDDDTLTILCDELTLDKKVLFKKNGITIQGQTDIDGKPITTIKGAGNSVEQFRIEGYNVTVRDLIFDNIANGGTARENQGVYFYYPNDVYAADRINKLINCESINTYWAIFSGRNMNFEMEDCTFTKIGTTSSVFMDRPTNVIIKDCSFSGQDGYALHIDNGVADGVFNVTNCDFTGGVVTAGASENNTGDGNEIFTFTDCDFNTSSGEYGGWYASYYSSGSMFVSCTFDADFDGAGTGQYSYFGSYVYLDPDCTQGDSSLDTTFFYNVGDDVLSGVNVTLNSEGEITGGIFVNDPTGKLADGYVANEIDGTWVVA